MRILLLPLLLGVLIFSQANGQQYNFKRFSVEEGLPRSGVYCMLEDTRGFLWIGTEGGGLARFDGREFVTFTTGNGLPDNTIRCLFEDKAGNLWMGTNGQGLSVYNGKTFRNFTKENGLSNDYVRCITQSRDGNIWIGTFGGGINEIKLSDDSISVQVFDKESTIKSNNSRAAFTDSDGNLWFGTDKGLYRTDGETWKFFGMESGLSHERILVLYEDKLKNIWVGTQSGVNRLIDTTFVSYGTEDGLIHERIRGICQDESGNLWFGTQNGVSRFDGQNFVSFTEANGLSNDRIRYITTDRTGNLWFGTYFGGICRFSGEEFIHFTEKDGVTNNQVLSIYNNHDGDIWLGTLEGITELKPNPNGTWRIEQNPLGKAFSDKNINVIVGAPNNEIWFGTDSGILVKNKKKVTWLKTDGQVFRENVKAILFEPNGSIWLGSDQGVTRYSKTDDGFVFDQYHSNPNINESEVSSLTLDALGRIWIGYLTAQIVIFENDEFIVPDLPESLTDVSAILEGPYGYIWIATEGSGLFKHLVSPKETSASDFEQLGSESGLSSSDHHQLVFDNEKNLWIGTASGIDQIELNNRAEIKRVNHYSRIEGFIGTETNENAACVDIDGNIWFGTIQGVTRYNPKAKPKALVENLLHITNVHPELGDIDWQEEGYAEGIGGYFGLPQELKLPYAHNHITFEYNAIDLREPANVRYQWKLDGYNEEWSSVEALSSHSFNNLPPKQYTFHVRSINGQGVWNAKPTSFQFQVIAPFWMRWWFIAICFVAVALIIRMFIKVRERRLIAEQEKLQQKVDERTKELRHEKERSDELLLNILPIETAEELKKNGYASVQQYDMVSVLFTDFVGFTNITEGISHQQLVNSLDQHFRLFDEVMDKYHIEKIKTIGDAYMAAGGIPTRTITNPMSVVAAGLEMIHLLKNLNKQKELKGETAWNLRLGIHTGSVISGVVGKNKFAFDIWGDAVNTAARMESSGEVMKVNISGSTYKLVEPYFECTPRGKIKAKNKGEIEMYFVERLKPEYSNTEDGCIANSTFMSILRKEEEKISTSN